MEKPNVIEAFEGRPDLKQRVIKIEKEMYTVRICDSWSDLFASLFLVVNDRNYKPEKIKEIMGFNCGERGNKNILFSGKYMPIRVWGTNAQLIQGTFRVERKDGKAARLIPILSDSIYLLVGPLMPE